MKTTEKTLWGLALICLGCIIGLNALDLIDVDLFFDGWWTLFIIVPCFIGLFGNYDKKGNLIGLIFGVLLLINAQELITWRVLWGLMITIVLVTIGLSIIFGPILRDEAVKKIDELNKKFNDKENVVYSTTFGSDKIEFSKKEFTNCKANATFGEMILDLRNAKIKENAVLNANATFGSIKIITPKDVNIKVSSSSTFGEVNDKSIKDENSKNTLFINASAIFGEITII